MFDLNQPQDVIDLMREGEMTNEQITKVCKQVIYLIKIKNRLEYLRGEIEAERISYGEIAELQLLADYIEPGDVLLLEWAGVPEFEAA